MLTFSKLPHAQFSINKLHPIWIHFRKIAVLGTSGIWKAGADRRSKHKAGADTEGVSDQLCPRLVGILR